MLCARCGGLLVRERLFEADGMSSTEQAECDRCVNCGTLEDTTIRANRQLTRPPVLSREPRGPRIQQEHPAALMRPLVNSNHPRTSRTFNFGQPYPPPTGPDTRHGNHAHHLRTGGDVDDGKTRSFVLQEVPNETASNSPL